MQNHLKFIRETLYALKREYGRPVDLYKLSTVTNNVTTGVKQTTRQKQTIRRGIILPESYIKHKVYSLSFIAANKNFTYGGLFNRDIKVVLIDAKDLPRNYEMDPEGYLIIDHKRFNFKNVQELDLSAGYILIVEATDGSAPESIYEINIYESIRLTEGVTSVIE